MYRKNNRVTDLDLSSKKEGNIIAYDSSTGKFVSKALDGVTLTSPLGIVYSLKIDDNGTLSSILYKESVSILPETVSIGVGSFAQLSFKMLPEVNMGLIKTLVWSSSNQTVANVDNNGLIKGIASGNTIITAIVTLDNGEIITATRNVSVTSVVSNIPVQSISLNAKTLSLNVGGSTYLLVASISPSNATNKNMNWSSSNNSVATVNSSGLVTSVGTGSCIISAVAHDGGFTDTCSISVVQQSTSNVNGIIFNLDFSSKEGNTSNTILDTVSGTSCTLVNVSHGGSSDGYVNNKGLLLTKSGYIEIPSNVGTLHDAIDFSKGVTFEYVAYNLDGVYFRTINAEIRSYNININLKYSDINGNVKSGGNTSSWLVDPYGEQSNRTYLDSLNGTDELNVVAIRFYPDGRSDVSVNGWRSLSAPTPSDFSSYTNMLGASPLYLRRDHVALNTTSTTISSFSIYNKTLTNAEITQRYESIKQAEPLYTVTAQPTSVQIQSGENQALTVVASPKRYTPLFTTIFDSGNDGYVTVDQKGLLMGVNNGNTEISVTSTYNGSTFINYVPVTVGASSVTPPTSTRIIDGICLNRTTESLEVGREFVAMATTLPFDVYNDNIIVWESSNPQVCSINYGVLSGLSAGTSTITAYDGTKTFSKSFTVTVTEPVNTTLTTAEIYTVALSDYSISNNNTNSTSTTNGIQSAMNYASSNGYKKIVFPAGTYLVSPVVRTLKLPTEMIVDFSNSIINIEFSSMSATGYSMFLIENTKNTKLINAIIYGENQSPSATLEGTNEACLSVLISKDAYRSGLENCTISKSVGFNITSYIEKGSDQAGRHPSKDNWQIGNISDVNGQNDNSVTERHFRNINYLNISGLEEHYQLGYTQGYFGYPHLRSRLYSIFFYDLNHNFIEAHKYNLQFYNYKKPTGAVYAKIVIYQDVAPTSQDSDFVAVAMLRTIHMPTDCFIKNCTIEDNWSTGIAMIGGQGWVIEGNTFNRNGKRMPACDIDWEDGWETSVGDICRNNTFNSPSGIIVSGVCSVSVHDNTFNNSHLHVYERTANWRAYGNFFNGKGNNRNLKLGCQADSYFARNILSGVTYDIPITEHTTGALYKVHTLNNTIV